MTARWAEEAAREFVACGGSVESLAAEIERVAAEEREACAQLCEQRGIPHTWASENADDYAIFKAGCDRCADAIRARGGEREEARDA